MKNVDGYLIHKFTHYILSKNKNKVKYCGWPVYLRDINFRGIQASIIFMTINCIVFYGLYKNIKFYLKEKFDWEDSLNFFIAAGVSQFLSMILAFPLENIKTTMQSSKFNYYSLFSYYKNLIIGKPLNIVLTNIKNEYSGFFSHLILSVVYESITLSIYESLMKMKNKNKYEY
jgi:hypothetical protein